MTDRIDPPPGSPPSPPITAEALDQWAEAAERRRLRLHMLATDPSLAEREKAFAAMGEALKAAIEEVRVAGQSLREYSEQLRQQSRRLTGRSAPGGSS